MKFHFLFCITAILIELTLTESSFGRLRTKEESAEAGTKIEHSTIIDVHDNGLFIGKDHTEFTILNEAACAVRARSSQSVG